MARATEFAHLLISFAAREEEPDYLTHLQLQKLLYYVQGWSLAIRGETAFSEHLEAWVHGPVVAEIYSDFAEYEKGPIPESVSTEWRKLTSRDRFFGRMVWSSYKKYSPVGLRNKTHNEEPWKNARGGIPKDARSDAPITSEALQEFFLSIKGTDKDFPFVGIPSWERCDDPEFVRIAQEAFLANAPLLSRLAK